MWDIHAELTGTTADCLPRNTTLDSQVTVVQTGSQVTFSGVLLQGSGTFDGTRLTLASASLVFPNPIASGLGCMVSLTAALDGTVTGNHVAGTITGPVMYELADVQHAVLPELRRHVHLFHGSTLSPRPTRPGRGSRPPSPSPDGTRRPARTPACAPRCRLRDSARRMHARLGPQPLVLGPELLAPHLRVRDEETLLPRQAVDGPGLVAADRVAKGPVGPLALGRYRRAGLHPSFSSSQPADRRSCLMPGGAGCPLVR